MLTYLIQVTQDLIMCVVMAGMVFAYADLETGTRGRIILASSTALGLVAGLVCAYVRNTTKLMDSGYFNLTLYFLSAALLVLFVLFDIHKIHVMAWAELVRELIMALFLLGALTYALQYLFGYIKIIYDAEGTVFSTDFLLDLIGWFIGIVLCVVAAVAINRSARRIDALRLGIILKLVMLLMVIRNIGAGVQTMIQHNIVRSNHTLFVFVKYTTNSTALFIYLSLAFATIIPILLWWYSFRQTDPYKNPAEQRKVRAKWRNIRRWSSAFIICVILSVLNLTVVYAYDNRAIELSPVEEYSKLEDDVVYVSLDLVSDGHLHRFAYTSDTGTEIRFIVIKKSGSTSYGVGMDSCDICGETGYYERDDQIVCKKCDVVMNTNTIGFAGGCNPKVFSYTVADGYIQIPVDGLVQYEKDFT